MKDQTGATTTNPRWWNTQHTSAWERVKEAMRRDWEQTKADMTKRGGTELNQNVGDTVRQAVGSQPMPAPNQPNPSHGTAREDWTRAEPGVRYGYVAREQYGTDHADWDDRLEGKLRTEWNDLKSGRTWDEVKSHVRHGWDAARRKT